MNQIVENAKFKNLHLEKVYFIVNHLLESNKGIDKAC